MMNEKIAKYCLRAMLCEVPCEECEIYGQFGTDHCEHDAIRYVLNELEELIRYRDNGWIPCSERLPEVFEDTKSSDVVLICGYDKQKDYHWQAMGFYVCTEAIKRWFFAECKDTDKPIDWIDIVAWQPLPAPYQPKGEK